MFEGCLGLGPDRDDLGTASRAVGMAVILSRLGGCDWVVWVWDVCGAGGTGIGLRVSEGCVLDWMCGVWKVRGRRGWDEVWRGEGVVCGGWGW